VQKWGRYSYKEVIMKRIMLLCFALIAVVGLCVSGDWEPTRGIEFIAPSGAGGGWDAICRNSAFVLGEANLVTQPMVVFNMSGGGGMVALAYIIEQQEGNEHLLFAASNSISFRMASGLTDYTYADVTPIAQIASEFGVYAVATGSSYETLADIVAALQADPTSVTFGGGSSPGSMDHIKVALLGKDLGLVPTDLTYVPFQGGGEALAALLGGHVDVFTGDLSEILGYVTSGEITVAAILSEERLPNYQDIPTAVEQGIDVIFPVWRGLCMPPGLSDEAVTFWTGALEQMVQTDEWAAVLVERAWSDVTKFGTEFSDFVNAEYDSYKLLLEELGFQ